MSPKWLAVILKIKPSVVRIPWDIAGKQQTQIRVSLTIDGCLKMVNRDFTDNRWVSENGE